MVISIGWGRGERNSFVAAKIRSVLTIGSGEDLPL
ncbi:hypothetical protein ACVWXN_010030 [Bradyrhizobium sp. i1.4.4]